MMIENVKIRLNELSTIKTKEFNSKIFQTPKEIIGVKYPELRVLAKEICKGEYIKFLNECDHSSLEMQVLSAFVLGKAKISEEERLKYLASFIKEIKDWAFNDALASSLKSCSKNLKLYYNFLLNYKNSKNEFEVRFIVVMFLNYYLNDNYVYKVFEIIKDIYYDAYYIKMAIAWLLATMAIDYPNLVLEYLKDNKNDDFIVNQTIQKMKDSYRISPKLKEEINVYKRKKLPLKNKY